MDTITRTRTSTSTCTKSRVDAVLDLVLGDIVGLIARGAVSRERALDWLADLTEVLVLEAVDRFQVKVVLPSGKQLALDYEVSDDGTVRGGDACGGLSSHWIPLDAKVSLVIGWRTEAPKLAAARELLRHRGWTTGSLLEASGPIDRRFSEGGYGLYRRTVGGWPT